MNIRVVSILLAVLVYNLFFFRTPWGISFTALIVGLTVLLFANRRPVRGLAVFFALSSIGTSLLYSVTSNGFLQTVDVIFTWGLLLLAFLSAISEKPLALSTMTVMTAPFFMMFQYLGCLFWSILSQFEHMGSSVGSKRWQPVLRGIVLSIPLLLILFMLLSSADPIFAKVANDILKQIGPRSVRSIVIAVVLLPFVVSWAAKLLDYPLGLAKRVAMFTTEASVVLSLIIGLLGLFLVVQFQYLFHTVAETELVKFGVMTYSAYVRKGFVELLLASVMVYGVVFITVWMNQYRERKNHGVISWLNSLLIIEVFALIASNAQRVSMYQLLHGLTRIRVFGSIFLVWLAVMLVVLFVKNWMNIARARLTVVEILATLGVLVFAHVIRVDYLIAVRFPPTVNKEIDYYYISRLSYDAVEGWPKAIVDAEKIIVTAEGKKEHIDAELNRKLYYADTTLYTLRDRTDFLKKIYGQKNWPWQIYNVSEYQAWQYIANHPEFASMQRLIDRLEKVKQLVPDVVRQETRYDRSSDHPLVGD